MGESLVPAELPIETPGLLAPRDLGTVYARALAAEPGGAGEDALRSAYEIGRLGIAVTRGLLLDLLATADRDGVDAAIEAWIALNEAAMKRS